MNISKPPLGVMPKNIWISRRIEDLKGAIKEHIDAGLIVDPDWLKELNEWLSPDPKG